MTREEYYNLQKGDIVRVKNTGDIIIVEKLTEGYVITWDAQVFNRKDLESIIDENQQSCGKKI